MQFVYNTKRLILKILPPEYGREIYQFYNINKDFLEPVEPKRPENFYSSNFHTANLSCEYSNFLKQTYFRYWLFLENSSDSIPIGSICFSNLQRGAFNKCSLGYKLSKEYCHMGYMHEALSFLIPVLLRETKLHRIEAFVMPDNYPSIKLLQSLDFIEEGYISSYAKINGTWKDHLIFSYISPYNQ